jgi:hypothetical protein
MLVQLESTSYDPVQEVVALAYRDHAGAARRFELHRGAAAYVAREIAAALEPTPEPTAPWRYAQHPLAQSVNLAALPDRSMFALRFQTAQGPIEVALTPDGLRMLIQHAAAALQSPPEPGPAQH